ncbi:MAG: glycoside hydrolase family 57 protein [Vampirovibrio sp.]|nr:glycoside hydrolase family 57 protein [Vampirovibrio sp.]
MSYGSFVLMLHSHLPFYRKAGMWPFGEENLYECIAETYLPLLNALEELVSEGIQPNITVGITPILAEQLADSHLQQGFIDYIQTRLKAASEDIERYPDPKVKDSKHLAYLADYYHKHFTQLLDDFINRYDKNLLKAFKDLQDTGAIEITTSGATHGFSPLLGLQESINAQFKVGVETYKRHFGKDPKGCWLPECAYRPAHSEVAVGKNHHALSTDAFLYENGLQYFFTEYHAIEGSTGVEARRDFGLYGAIQYIPTDNPQTHRIATGFSTDEAYWMKDYPVAVMGRNNRASFQVWSAADGYPGDGVYREFHKKDEQSGLHFWRITSKDCELGDKGLYDPVKALEQTTSHADHYANMIYHQLKEHYEATGKERLVMVSFDTELFGHWWFEGITWLKQVIRQLNKVEQVSVETASAYLHNTPPQCAIELPESTWGQGGHYWVWQNQHTDWMWPIIHQAEETMTDLVVQHPDESDPMKVRILNQAFRELLLLQSSDWPFLVTTFQAKDYAIERFNEHVDNFKQLADMLTKSSIDNALLSTLEEKNNPFPNIHYRWYQGLSGATDAMPPQPVGV